VRNAARVDTGTKELRAYAESIGFLVVVINDVVDCLLVWGGVLVFIVDWKSERGTARGDLTSEQSKLVAKGVPVKFISTPAQLDALKVEAQIWLRS